MALFLNGERQSLWTDKPQSDRERDAADSDHAEEISEEMREVEETIRKTLESKKFLSRDEDFHFGYLYSLSYGSENRFLDNKQKDFATYRNRIIVPGRSTQELSTVIQISAFTGNESVPNNPALSGNTKANHSFNSHEEDSATISILDRKERLAARVRNMSLAKVDARSETLIAELVKDYIGLGEAFLKTEWIGGGRIGEARYYFHVAYMIAEAFCKDDRRTWNDARFEYAKFLDDNGWHRTASDVVKGLAADLFGRGSGNEENPDSWPAAIDRVASIHLKSRNFFEAETLYKKGLNHFSKNSRDLNIRSAQFMERVASTQVFQGHYREAHASYMRLLGQRSSARQTILRNLGFIERRLRQFSEAKVHYKCSLAESRGGTDDVLTRSGLFTCLRELDADPEELADIWASSVRYVNFNLALSLSPFLSVPFGKETFSFAIARQLESLLSVCSIPLKIHPSHRNIALMNADPLNCLCAGRVA